LLLWIGEGRAGADVATDATANKNHGTMKGGAKWVDGGKQDNKGISLTAKGRYIEIPGKVLKPNGTIEFWFKPSWDGGDGEDFRIFDASMGSILYLYL